MGSVRKLYKQASNVCENTTPAASWETWIADMASEVHIPKDIQTPQDSSQPSHLDWSPNQLVTSCGTMRNYRK